MRFDDAITAYEAVLGIDPENNEIKGKRNLAKKLRKEKLDKVHLARMTAVEKAEAEAKAKAEKAEAKLRGKAEASAKAKKVPRLIKAGSLEMEFAWIPPGTFFMGSPTEEEDRKSDETQHKVTLTKGFYMGVYTVTQEQWQTLMGVNPSFFKGEKNLPVETVSWDDCQQFIKKLREKDKKPYRLPTEAEWEHACRAGTRTPFYFGKTISTGQANYDGDFAYANGAKGLSRKKTTPVGSFPANAWGLYDMHGNVWQWCQDRYGDYSKEDMTDPLGPDVGEYRILRGGSWYGYPGYCRSAFRDAAKGMHGSSRCGFRLCFFLD
ncbi:MAG: formylglycine-generating enzyme family protein [Planctomycetes bacterium]|nr:formylglycine-generating enzyme family protein [Planctomycetota bacterium]